MLRLLLWKPWVTAIRSFVQPYENLSFQYHIKNPLTQSMKCWYLGGICFRVSLARSLLLHLFRKLIKAFTVPLWSPKLFLCKHRTDWEQKLNWRNVKFSTAWVTRVLQILEYLICFLGLRRLEVFITFTHTSFLWILNSVSDN